MSDVSDNLLDTLRGGDRRSIQGVPEVIRRVSHDPGLFGTLFDGLAHEDPLVRMRCADAIEKFTAIHPEYLEPFKRQVMQLASESREKELRWHFAQMLPRLDLDSRERRRAVNILNSYLEDSSSIVRTFAMQALADIAAVDEELRPPIVDRIRDLTQCGTPAMKSRGRKLLARLAETGAEPTAP